MYPQAIVSTKDSKFCAFICIDDDVLSHRMHRTQFVYSIKWQFSCGTRWYLAVCALVLNVIRDIDELKISLSSFFSRPWPTYAVCACHAFASNVNVFCISLSHLMFAHKNLTFNAICRATEYMLTVFDYMWPDVAHRFVRANFFRALVSCLLFTHFYYTMARASHTISEASVHCMHVLSFCLE